MTGDQYSIGAEGAELTLDLRVGDPSAHVFCHPTNIAFDGKALYSANLGRWHITKVAMDIGATPLHNLRRGITD